MYWRCFAPTCVLFHAFSTCSAPCVYWSMYWNMHWELKSVLDSVLFHMRTAPTCVLVSILGSWSMDSSFYCSCACTSHLPLRCPCFQPPKVLTWHALEWPTCLCLFVKKYLVHSLFDSLHSCCSPPSCAFKVGPEELDITKFETSAPDAQDIQQAARLLVATFM
uniref:Uncharacterized protein n=1 Tax=Dunaliella tertiolecta TaxID=3047 RepID=A0A7S3QRU1_DUNTE